MSWFWCLDHSQAEENVGCGSQKRLGPYATPTQAAQALKRINSREAQSVEENPGTASAPPKAARR